MFIQSHLVHEIFANGLNDSFLILFAASDKLIKYKTTNQESLGSISQLLTEWLVQSV